MTRSPSVSRMGLPRGTGEPRRALGLILTMVLLAGCGGGVASNLHVVSSTGSGEMVDASRKSRKGLSQENADAYIDRILDTIQTEAPLKDGKRQVLLYIHGGLKYYTQSYEKAEADREKILADGFYPVFVVWPSNLERAYLEHMFLIRQGRRSKVLGPLTAPLFLAGDLATGIIRAPGTMVQQLTTGVGTWGEKATTYRRDSTIRQEELEKSRDHPQGLRLVTGEDHRGGWDKAGRLLLYAVTLPVKLVTAVIVDSLGEPAYDNMIRRTETQFRRTKAFERSFNTIAPTPEYATDHGGGGAVLEFIQALEERGGTVPMEITLIGHSMGTIVANRILQFGPDLPIRDIVYLGAACTIDDWSHSVVPFLERNPDTQFYNLTLHPVAEARQTMWKTLDLAPRGSLLEWIDNFLANPRSPAQRVMGKWENIMVASHLIPVSVRGQVTLRSFDVGGGKDPQKHGELNDPAYWRKSYWTGNAEPE